MYTSSEQAKVVYGAAVWLYQHSLTEKKVAFVQAGTALAERNNKTSEWLIKILPYIRYVPEFGSRTSMRSYLSLASLFILAAPSACVKGSKSCPLL